MLIRIKPGSWHHVEEYLCHDFPAAGPDTLFPVALKWKRSAAGILYLTRNFHGAGIDRSGKYKETLFRDEELMQEACRMGQERFRWLSHDMVIETEMNNRSLAFILKR